MELLWLYSTAALTSSAAALYAFKTFLRLNILYHGDMLTSLLLDTKSCTRIDAVVTVTPSVACWSVAAAVVMSTVILTDVAPSLPSSSWPFALP